MGYRFMQVNKNRYPIREMAGLLEVSSGGLLPVRKEGAVGTEEPEGRRIDTSYPGDTAYTS
jgi:hypothetical protein